MIRNVLYTLSISFASAAALISTLSLHDALPISRAFPPRRLRDRGHGQRTRPDLRRASGQDRTNGRRVRSCPDARSEEHTSELQSHSDLVCRLLLEKRNPFPFQAPLRLCQQRIFP